MNIQQNLNKLNDLSNLILNMYLQKLEVRKQQQNNMKKNKFQIK